MATIPDDLFDELLNRLRSTGLTSDLASAWADRLQKAAETKPAPDAPDASKRAANDAPDASPLFPPFQSPESD